MSLKEGVRVWRRLERVLRRGLVKVLRRGLEKYWRLKGDHGCSLGYVLPKCPINDVILKGMIR